MKVAHTVQSMYDRVTYQISTYSRYTPSFLYCRCPLWILLALTYKSIIYSQAGSLVRYDGFPVRPELRDRYWGQVRPRMVRTTRLTAASPKWDSKGQLQSLVTSMMRIQ